MVIFTPPLSAETEYEKIISSCSFWKEDVDHENDFLICMRLPLRQIMERSWKSWKDHGYQGNHGKIMEKISQVWAAPIPAFAKDLMAPDHPSPETRHHPVWSFLIFIFLSIFLPNTHTQYSYSSINISSEIVKLVICNNWPSSQWWWWWWWCWQWCWWWWRRCWWWWWWCLCF